MATVSLMVSFATSNVANNNKQFKFNAANATTDLLEYVLLDKKHPCSRTCTVGGQPMVCRYKFTIEWYHTLSKACYSCPYNQTDCFRPHCIPGDGKKRSIVVVNRQMPGPAIEVRYRKRFFLYFLTCDALQ